MWIRTCVCSQCWQRRANSDPERNRQCFGVLVHKRARVFGSCFVVHSERGRIHGSPSKYGIVAAAPPWIYRILLGRRVHVGLDPCCQLLWLNTMIGCLRPINVKDISWIPSSYGKTCLIWSLRNFRQQEWSRCLFRGVHLNNISFCHTRPGIVRSVQNLFVIQNT